MKSCLLSQEQFPEGGSSPEETRVSMGEDSRLRTERYESDDPDSGILGWDGDIEEASDETRATVIDAEPVAVSDVTPEPTSTEKMTETTPAQDELREQTQAAKKGQKGGKNKKGNQGGGGGQKKKNKEEPEWNNPEKVKPAIERWENELLALGVEMQEQEKLEEGDESSVVMKALEKKKELLENRIEKGKTKVALERKKQELHSEEDELDEVLKKMEEHAKAHPDDPPPQELVLRRERLQLNVSRGKEEVQDMMEEYIRDYSNVPFNDEVIPELRTPLYVHAEETKKKESKAIRAIKAPFVIAGATIGSMAGMTWGLINDLWKSWRGYTKKPNETFGGWGLKDFFWREDGKKK